MGFQKAAGTLGALGPGQAAVVRKVDGHDALSLRLLEMGLTPGVHVEIVKRAPLGDPIEIRARGFHLSIRRREAARVQVEAVSTRTGAER